MKLSTIRRLIRSLILRIECILVRFIELLHAVRLTKVLAQVKLGVLRRIQTAYGMARPAEVTHLVPVMGIRLRAKPPHIIPDARVIM